MKITFEIEAATFGLLMPFVVGFGLFAFALTIMKLMRKEHKTTELFSLLRLIVRSQSPGETSSHFRSDEIFSNKEEGGA